MLPTLLIVLLASISAVAVMAYVFGGLIHRLRPLLADCAEVDGAVVIGTHAGPPSSCSTTAGVAVAHR